MDVPIQVETGLFVRGARGRVVDVHGPDGSAGPASSDLMKRDEIRVVGGYGSEVLLYLGERMVMIKGDERPRLRGCGPRKHKQDEENGSK